MPALPPLYRWDLAQPRALVHIVHGMSEHAARYARLAALLNGAGYAVWGHDHRGHGRNVGESGLGHFADTEGWRAVIDDAWAVSCALQATYPGLPLVLFAHSMGSFVGQALIAEHGAAYRAVVLSGSNGPPDGLEAIVRAVAAVQRAVQGGRRPGTWTHRLVMGDYNRRFAPNRTPCDWLSRDAAEVDRYVADPLCGQPLSAQSWVDFLAGRKLLCRPERLVRIPKTLPILLIAGALDPVGANGRGVQRLCDAYQAAGLERVRSRLYEGARHELTNELNRDEVTADLIAWLDEVLAQVAAVSA
ncbi:MAG TPA: alpha/beta hydrolase [Burkholderiaceae bacterium]|nr:alpha/beta hydrolase [Burkholderiaceae bacterium]